MAMVIMTGDHNLYDDIRYDVNYIIPLSKMTSFVCVYRYDIDKPSPKLSAQVSTDSLRLI